MLEFKERGNFWFPESIDEKIPGEIRIKNNEISLELFFQNKPKDIFDEILNKKKNIPKIFCQLNTKGGYGTLLDVNILNYNHNTNIRDSISSTNINLIVSEFFLGEIYDNEIQVDNISFEISNIEEWIGESYLKIKHNKKDISKQNIHCKSKKIFEINLPEGKKLKLFSYIEGINHKIFIKKLSLKQKTKFTIKNNLSKKSNFNELKLLSYKIQNLLSLLVGSNVQIQNIQFDIKIDASTKEIKYFSSRFNNSEIKKLEVYHILIPYWILNKKDFEKIVNNWLIIYEKNRIIFDFFLSSLNNSSSYLYHTTLTKIQCLEAIHRNNFDKKIFKKEMVEKNRKAIQKLKFSKKFINKLLNIYNSTINHMSLKERLNDLFKKIDSSLISDLYINENFLKYCLDLRNGYSHLNSNPIREDQIMYLINEKLKFLLLYLILNKLLKLNKKKIIKCYEGNLMYSPINYLKKDFLE